MHLMGFPDISHAFTKALSFKMFGNLQCDSYIQVLVVSFSSFHMWGREIKPKTWKNLKIFFERL